MNNGRWDGVGVAITDPSGVRINIGVGIHVGVYVDVGTPVGVGVGIHAGVHARRAKPDQNVFLFMIPKQKKSPIVRQRICNYASLNVHAFLFIRTLFIRFGKKKEHLKNMLSLRFEDKNISLAGG